MSTPRVLRLILLVAILLTVAACGGESEPSGAPPDGVPATLTDTAWIVRSVAGRAPIPGAVPTISFSATQLAGTGGCNHLGGRYQYEASSGRIAFRELGMTAMGCLQAGVSDFETVFVQALGSATDVRVDAIDQLLLGGPAGQIILVRLEHPAAP